MDDKKHVPLQVADLLAYEARYKTINAQTGEVKDRAPMLRILDHIYFIGVCNKPWMLAVLQANGIPIDQDDEKLVAAMD